MKTKRSTYIGKTLLVCLSFLLTACGVKEDRDDCPPDPEEAGSYRLTWQFLHHNRTSSGQGTDLFEEDVDLLDLYIYGEDETLVDHITLNGPFTNGYELEMDLDPGIYNIVTWGNAAKELVTTHNYTLFSEARLCLVEDAENKITRHLNRLFHGNITAQVEAGTDKLEVVSLMNNTNYLTVNISIRDEDESDVTDRYRDELEIFIVDRDAEYHFDNSIPNDCKTLFYYPWSVATGRNSILTAQIASLRFLTQNDDSTLIVRRTDSTTLEEIELYNTALIEELIMKHDLINSQDDLDREEEYMIDLYLYSSGGSYQAPEITVAGWKVIVENIEIGR